MRLVRPRLVALALLALPSALAWSCETVNTKSGASYDLRKLGGERDATKQSDTPPTKSEARVRLDLCGSLKKQDNVPDEDQCPEGTQVCLTLLNHKAGASPPERVTAVIPFWTGATEDNDITAAPLGRKGASGLWLDVKAPQFAGNTQTLNLTLHCDRDATDPNPTLVSYTNGELILEWATPDACPVEPGSPDHTDDDAVGFFAGLWYLIKFVFWLGFFGLIAYFVVGVVYNHQTYSARGWDLVPNRDFWREFPTLMSDLTGHLFSNVRSSSGRGGYSSLG